MPVRPVVAFAAALLATGPAAAQYTWDGGGGTGNWNNALNWSADTLPVAGASTVVTLGGTAQTATTMNLASPFLLGQLVLGSNATNGFTVTGGAFQFAPGGKIVFNGPAASNSGLRVDSTIDFGTGAVTVETNSNAGGGTTYFEIVLGGPITGSGTLTKGGTQPGEMVLAGRNGSFTGTLAIAAGQVQLAAANALGRGATVTVGPSTLLLAGYLQSTAQGFAAATGVSQAIGSVEGSGTFQVGQPTSAATVWVGFTVPTGNSRTFAGTVSAGNAGSVVAKVGTGQWEFTGSSTAFLAGLAVRDGTVLLDGAGALAPATTTAAVGGTVLNTGGTLRLDNGGTNTENRIQNNGVVALAGGTLRLDGFATANTNEILGGFDLQAGQSTVVVNPAAVGIGTQLNVAPTRAGVVPFTKTSPTGTIFFRGENLGAFSATAPPATSAVAGVVFDTPATLTAFLVGGGGTGATTSVLPFALGSTTNGTEPDTLATYGTNGVRPLTAAEYAAFATAGNTNNVRDGGFTVGAATTRNALVVTGAVTLAGPLTLTAGALVATAAGTTAFANVGGTGTGAVLFGPSGGSTAYIATATGASLTLSTPVSAANIAKSGGGTLTFAATVTLGTPGTVAVNAGTLVFGGFGRVSPAIQTVTYQVSRGATLDVTTLGLTLNAGKTLTGNGTVAGLVTVASGGTLAPDALSGPGTLSVASMAWQGGGAYRWTATSAITDAGGTSPYTAGRVAGSGTLDLTSTTLNTTPFTIRAATLDATNAAGALYDFDPTASYSWTIATFDAGITGFAANKFTVDASGFAGATQAFAVTQSGNNLVLTYGTPVPEPGLALLAAAATRMLARRRRLFART